MENEDFDVELECPGCGSSIGYDEVIGSNHELGEGMGENEARCPACFFAYPTEDWFA